MDCKEMNLYHYTNGTKIKKIINSGVLKTTPENPKPREKPVCWLSSNTEWEKTANKISQTNGELKLLTQSETEIFCDGLYRFIVKKNNNTLQWPKIAVKSRMPENLKKVLLKRAKKASVNPLQWYGTLEDISIEGLEIEMLYNGSWTKISIEDINNQPTSKRETRYAKREAIREEDWNNI